MMDLIVTHINVARRLRAILHPKIIRLIKLIDASARKNSCSAFLVGGFVRDLLLGVKNFDLDIVIEGNAVEVARSLIQQAGGSYVQHKRFGTATAVLPWAVKAGKTRLDKIKLDFATARKELYKSPAALPTVEFSTVREDLFRRDFTINAMAIAVSKKSFGQLIDFFGGQKDLANKKIRVLHDASFIDDPTRIFRAVRFEQRFNFKIEPHTEALVKAAIERKMVAATEKQRLRDELILILSEEEPKKILKRMDALGELKFIHPKARFSKKAERFFDSIKESVSWFKLAYLKKRALDVWLIYLMALLDGLKRQEAQEVCGEFVFRKGEGQRLASYKKDCARTIRFLNRPGAMAPSEIFKRLEPLSYEVILAIMAKSGSTVVKRRVSDFLTKYNGVKLSIRGMDLGTLGFKAGPCFKRILTKTLYAKLDRGFKSKKQELEFVRKTWL